MNSVGFFPSEMIRLCRLVGGFRECSRRFSSGNGPFVSPVWEFPLIQEALFFRGWTIYVRWLAITHCSPSGKYEALACCWGVCHIHGPLFRFINAAPRGLPWRPSGTVRSRERSQFWTMSVPSR